MMGCKVFLTYKRKRLTGNGHARGNVCHGLVSVPKETPLCGPDLYDKLIDKRPLGDEVGNSSSSRLEAEKDVEESGKRTYDGDVVGLSSMDNCLQNKSCDPQTESSSSLRDVPSNNECIEGKLAPYSKETPAVTAADCIGQKPPFKKKTNLESHDSVSVSKTTSIEISASVHKDNPTVGDSAEVTKFKAPLITFIRRCKRKRNTEVADTQEHEKLLIDENSEFSTDIKRSKVVCDNTFSHAAANEKGCSLGDVTNLKPIAEVCDASDVPQIENVVPKCGHSEPALEAKVLVLEGEEPLDDQSVSKDVFHEDEKVLDQNDHITDDIQQDLSTGSLGISLNNAAKDFSSNDKGKGKQPAKDHDFEREEFRAILNDGLKATVERSRPFLDMSITPTDSSGTAECNAYLESNSQKQSVHAVTETLLGSLDSTSRSRAAISHQTSPQEILNIGNERLGESSSTHHSYPCREAITYVEGPSSSCKDNDQASFRPFDLMSRNKCLQLFPEDNAENSARSVFMQPEVTNPEKRKSPPFLGLALPTRSKTTRFAPNTSFAAFPFLNFDETRQPFEDTLPQSSSSQLSSLLRHKSMLDGIVGRARALSERDVFQDKLKLYSSAWTEEELDSLWVGVRRYGRDNWNAMIRDPRLRFSSWRVARDLAERWEEEQSKLFEVPIPPPFQHSKAKGVSLGFNNFSTISGIWRETMAEETRLSLGDVYNHRERGKGSRRAKFKSAYKRNSGSEYLQRPGKNPYLETFKDEAFNSFKSKNMPENYPSSTNAPTAFMAAKGKGNLPHWLREAVFSSPSSQREPPPAPAVTQFAHSHVMHKSFPYFDHYELHVGQGNEMHQMGGALKRNNPQTSGGAHHLNHSSGKSPVADVIVINSDASSEETISDDRCAVP